METENCCRQVTLAVTAGVLCLDIKLKGGGGFGKKFARKASFPERCLPGRHDCGIALQLYTSAAVADQFKSSYDLTWTAGMLMDNKKMYTCADDRLIFW